jgi:predicted acetyltransferase
MKTLELRTAREVEELAELAPIVGWAFNDSVEGALKWLGRSPLEDVRLARVEGRVVGGLVAIPMGQWFGGESVPMLGLAGVAISAAERGAGLGVSMLSQVLREARSRGLVLSTLYPSTQALYRKLGYEISGTYCRVELRLAECPRFRSPLELRDARAEDQPAIERLYREMARERSGYLDRSDYAWGRVREYGGSPARAVVVHGDSGLEGYALVGQYTGPGDRHDLRLTDFVATTPGAVTRLLDFLACHRSTADTARWFGGPADQRLFALHDKIYKVQIDAYWMLRIIDVARALELRGYPELEREVELRVEDALLPENSGNYRLSVSQGRASVSRVARASGVRLDVRALAALYSGFLPPSELARAGAIEGDARSLATLALLFGGPSPALCDYF